jgi:hypothetical protein
VYRTIGMVWRKSSARQEMYAKFAEFFRQATGSELELKPSPCTAVDLQVDG